MSAPVTFDRDLVRRRLARARAAGYADFLMARVAEDLRDRLSVVQREFPLYVSKRESAALMPSFSDKTDRERFVEKLVELGMPWAAPTGTQIFNVERCLRWLDNWQRAGLRKGAA